MSNLSQLHPLYEAMQDTYEYMGDSYAGSDVIKRKGKCYLPPTVAMVLDGFDGTSTNMSAGNVAYCGYRDRARYPEYVKDAAHNMSGMVNEKGVIAKLPPEMQYLLESASPYGEPLSMIMQRVTMLQLLQGKGGLLVDLPSVESQTLKPYIAVYDAVSITNWHDNTFEGGDEDLQMVVLTECGQKFNPETFGWQDSTKYRLLIKNEQGEYVQGVYFDENFNPNDLKTILVKGEPLTQIPFVFFTDKDLSTDSPMPPLKWLADMSKGIYQSEADYRQNLFMQGQDTLVVKNGGTNRDGDLRTGSGAVIYVDGEQGDAKYIGVSANGLSEQRQAIENDKQEAAYRAGQFIGTKQAAQESGTAMETRIGARTITLGDVADAGAAAMQKALRIIAVWMGLDPETVTVTANKDFMRTTISGQELVQIITARNAGAPVSLQTMHQYCVDHGLSVLSFEDEMKLIKAETPGDIKPVIEQIDSSTGQGVGNSGAPKDPTPSAAKTNVDSRP